jgi:hypothetical protein
MLPAARVFTKEDPCTKVELHNCFFRGGQYVERAVVEARTEIGENAPKYLVKKGFVLLQTRKWVDYYVPTEQGKAWLHSGILRYLVLHPDRAKDCLELPKGFTRTAAKTGGRNAGMATATHATAPAAAPTAPIRRIIRRRV